MTVPSTVYYEFEGFRLDPTEGLLWRDGIIVPLQPKTFDTLHIFLLHAGRLLSKEDLLQMVWPDAFVEENNLAQNISLLRKTLGAHCIETIPRRGYRFTPPVRTVQIELPLPILQMEEYTTTRIVIDEAESPDDPAVVTLPTAAAKFLPASTNVLPEKVSTPHALQRSRAKWGWALAGVLLALLAVIGFKRWRKPPLEESWRAVTVTKLPNTGNSVQGVLSPDGRFIAHVVFAEWQWSLALRQIATARDVQLAAPAPQLIRHVAFAPDGNHVYFNREETKQDFNLYKVPVLGGLATRVAERVDDFALAPDGRFAFTRHTEQANALIVAPAEGGSETTVWTSTNMGLRAPAWSPDRRMLAFVAWEGSVQKDMRLMTVEVASGRDHQLTAQRWRGIYGVSWLPDGSGLLLAARMDKGAQLWRVAYPGGTAQPSTSDLFQYSDVSLAATGQTAVSPIWQNTVDLWLVQAGDPASAKKITTGAAKYFNPVWTPDGQIVCVSNASGHNNLWLLQADGSNPRPLTTQAVDDAWPAVAPDGRTVVFSSRGSLWRVGLDGNELRQLTQGQDDRNPCFTPDGQTVIYTAVGAQSQLWQVPLAGGAALRLSEDYATLGTVAPDGRSLAGSWKSSADPVRQLALFPFTPGTPIGAPSRSWELKTAANLRVVWHRDGRALLYNADANVLQQALTGGPPTHWTNFTEGQVNGFDLAPDGQRLVCARNLHDYALVLLKPAE